jgi:hypothetical protein
VNISNLGKAITYISEKRPLFFFGIAGAVFTIIGLIEGAWVLYIANAGRGVAVGSALVSVLFIVIGVFSVLTGLILNALTRVLLNVIAEEKEALMNNSTVSRGSDRALIREIKNIVNGRIT